MQGTEAEPESVDGTLAPGEQPATRSLPTDGPLSPGQLIHGRYEVVRLLGEGAMGAVYEAFHRGIERRVAIKVLHPRADQDPAMLQRFLTEARSAGRARHRNIVEVLDFGADGGTSWMVMEMLSGESLESFIEREAPVSAERAVAILDPLLRGLAHAHELGIIHRDLKPANLFLAREKGVDDVVPKILDFGIARHSDGDVRVTSTATIIGTPAYMPPEQIESSKHVSPAADQYAMGCVAYELLTGALPISADTLHMMLVGKMTRDPEHLHARRPDLPIALCDTVMRALDRDPAARFADVDALRRALLDALSAPVSAEPVAPAPTPEPAPVTAEPAVTAIAPPAPAPTSRRLFVAAALLTTAALTAAFIAMRPPEPAPVTPVTVAARHSPESPPPEPPPAPAPVMVVQDAGAVVAVADASVAAPREPARAVVRRATRERRLPLGRLTVDPSNPL